MRPFNYYSALGLGAFLGFTAAAAAVLMFVFMFLAAGMSGGQDNLRNLVYTSLILACCSGFGSWLVISTTQGIGVDVTQKRSEIIAEQERALELRRAQHEVDLLQLKNTSSALQEAYESRVLKARDQS